MIHYQSTGYLTGGVVLNNRRISQPINMLLLVLLLVHLAFGAGKASLDILSVFKTYEFSSIVTRENSCVDKSLMKPINCNAWVYFAREHDGPNAQERKAFGREN